MKTYLPKVDLQQRKWHLVDADGAVLGRLAVKVANVLRGRDKPVYTSHLDAGDFVVVINADKVVVTGKKENEKLITHAVKGMIPKNRLGRVLLTKLKIYRGSEHPHAAQQPTPLAVKD